MRNFGTFIAALLFLSLGVNAQIQNPGFESWTNNTYKIPFGFPLSSIQETIQNSMPLGVTQVAPGHAGNYGLRLETMNTSNGISASYIVTSNYDPMEARGGFPYSQKPDSLFLYAKYQIATGDTAVILLLFKKNSQVIAQNIFQIFKSSTDWKKLGFKIEGLTETPDSVIFAMASSNAITNSGMVVGSNITIDDISFDTSAPFPGGDFETWSDILIESADGWMTNQIDQSVGQNIEKTTDTPFGNSAMKIRTVGNSNYGFVTGVYNGQQQNNGLAGGFPCTLRDGVLRGNYKYFPIIEKDTANVSITFYKNGNYLMGTGNRLMASSSYTQFEVYFTLNTVPDMAAIRIESSNWPWWLNQNSQNNNHSQAFNDYLTARVGSVLYVDNLQMVDIALTMPQTTELQFQVKPNPASQFVQVLVPNYLAQGYTISLFDLTGKLLLSEKGVGSSHTLGLSSIESGVYQMKVSSSSGEEHAKLIVRK